MDAGSSRFLDRLLAGTSTPQAGPGGEFFTRRDHAEALTTTAAICRSASSSGSPGGTGGGNSSLHPTSTRSRIGRLFFGGGCGSVPSSCGAALFGGANFQGNTATPAASATGSAATAAASTAATGTAIGRESPYCRGGGEHGRGPDGAYPSRIGTQSGQGECDRTR